MLEEGNMHLKRTQNKLMKNGFLPEEQTLSFEKWIDVQSDGTPISFQIREGKICGELKVHGRRPDVPEADEFNSDFTSNVSEAIQLSRI